MGGGEGEGVQAYIFWACGFFWAVPAPSWRASSERSVATDTKAVKTNIEKVKICKNKKGKNVKICRNKKELWKFSHWHHLQHVN
jgi:hypothetical protein